MELQPQLVSLDINPSSLTFSPPVKALQAFDTKFLFLQGVHASSATRLDMQDTCVH